MFGARTLLMTLFALTISLGLAASGNAQGDKKKVEKKKQEVWTDANDPTIPVDFKFQGEYVGDKIGAQVIALGGGSFQAVIFTGGLPGAGWDGKTRCLMDGKYEKGQVNLASIPKKESRQYLAQSTDKFSATSKFPPIGQRDEKAGISDEMLTLFGDKGNMVLKRTVRTSPTMGGKAPDGAIVLFDGSNKDEWKGGRVDKATNLLNTDGSDITTKRKFSNYIAHVEFLLPFRPDARGQGRGNSGFYQVDHYEVQILDSFGLEGKNNECGGVYTLAEPKVNMCLPPLQWQTYDVEFTNAVREGDKVIKKARLTCRHNGVLIHDDIELKGATGGSRNEPEGTPGVLRLQGHGNPLQFRNIWIVEKK
jgi:hypothetical protein